MKALTLYAKLAGCADDRMRDFPSAGFRECSRNKGGELSAGSFLRSCQVIAACSVTLFYIDIPVLGAEEVPEADGATGIKEDFSRGWDHWHWEEPPGATIELDDGALFIDTREGQHRPGGLEGLNLWHPTPLADDWVMEWDIEPVAPKPEGEEPGNLLFMFNYRYEDEQRDIINDGDERTGHYTWLHHREAAVERHKELTGTEPVAMRGHTITYYRINPREESPYRIIVRKNPGFHLMDERSQTVDDVWNHRHTVRIVKRGDTYRFYQGDREEPEVEYEDSSEYGGLAREGYFGIRVWEAAVKVHGVAIRPLENEDGGEPLTK